MRFENKPQSTLTALKGFESLTSLQTRSLQAESTRGTAGTDTQPQPEDGRQSGLVPGLLGHFSSNV